MDKIQSTEKSSSDNHMTTHEVTTVHVRSMKKDSMADSRLDKKVPPLPQSNSDGFNSTQVKAKDQGGIQLARMLSVEDRQQLLALYPSPSHTTPTSPSHREPQTSTSVSPPVTSALQQSQKSTPRSSDALTPPLNTTPKYYKSRRQIKAKKSLFKTPVSPLLRNPVPVMGQTVYSPLKDSPTQFPWGDTICCYHCGCTINLLRASRLMKHLSKLMVQDVGRTVFDLEKLSDTGMASKCIYTLENSVRDPPLFSNNESFIATMLKSPPKKSEPLQKSSVPEITQEISFS